MKIHTAITRIVEEYTKATELDYVKDPVAWSLYRVWKQADEEGEASE